MIIDMLIFTIIAIVSDWLGAKIAKDFLYISVSQMFILLMIIRWDFWAIIPTILISLLRPLMYNYQGFNEYIIYAVPNLVLLLALVPLKLGLLKNINKSKLQATSYYTLFYLLFVITSGVLIKILISNQYGIIGDFPKYILMLVIGNIIYYLFVTQKTMLINIKEVQENSEKDREIDDNN